jgi:hypothetical protein
MSRTQRQLTSARLADALDVPPYQVVCQYGICAFEVNGRYPTAVTVPGVGRVYAKHFKNWAGRPLPEVVDTADFRDLEPSPEMLVAMLEVERR